MRHRRLKGWKALTGESKWGLGECLCSNDGVPNGVQIVCVGFVWILKKVEQFFFENLKKWKNMVLWSAECSTSLQN